MSATRLVYREQTNPTPQQTQGIYVTVRTVLDPEMQAVPTGTVSSQCCPDSLAPSHFIPDRDRRFYRFVGVAPSGGVLEGNHRTTRQVTGIEHRRVSRGKNGLTGADPQVDTAVSGQPFLGGWVEFAGNGRRVTRRPVKKVPQTRRFPW